MPLDKSSDLKGLFPCGRDSDALESKIVSFPAGFKCDNCILQLSWRDSKDIYYTCSDVSYPYGLLYYGDQKLSNLYLNLNRPR